MGSFGTPYQLRYDICAFAVYMLILLVFFRKKDTHRAQNKIFFLMLIGELISVVADFSATIMTAHQDIFPRPLGSAMHIIYLTLHLFSPAALSAYIILICGSEFKIKKFAYGLLYGPWAIVTLMILTNPIHKGMFYYDAAGSYTRGPLMYFMYATAIYYIPFSIVFLFYSRKNLPSERFLSIISFILASIAATITQFFFKYVLIELFVHAVAGLWILFTIENDDEVIHPITQVYNRKAFALSVANPISNKADFRIILVTLTNLNYYTNLVGFTVMQKVTKNVAKFLSDTAGITNTFDLENGSFAVTLYKDNQKAPSGQPVEEVICEAFMHNWIYKDFELDFNTQLCIINLPRDVSSIEELMTIADITSVKTGNKVTIVQNDLLADVKRQAAVENAILNAVHNKSLQVYLQPIWDAKTNRIHSAEALVRLFDKGLGEISPNEFIPIAEKNGTIKAIGEFVFEETCRIYKEYNLKDIGIDFIEVNMSAAQLVHKDLAEKLNTIMDKYELDSHTINLEITETSAVNTPEAFQKTINDLHNLNFNFSLDDYGTGYSNLSYIVNMDFAMIKIDKSVLWEAQRRNTAYIVLENTVRMIKEMDIRIVVEGVETEEQKNMVLDLGCDYIQGYYFCKPVPKDQFIQYVKEFNECE